MCLQYVCGQARPPPAPLDPVDLADQIDQLDTLTILSQSDVRNFWW